MGASRHPAPWHEDTKRLALLCYRGLWVLALLVIAGGEGLLYWSAPQTQNPHQGGALEHWPGFYALFGFAGSAALALAAAGLRRALLRGEDYYGAGEPSDAERNASQGDGHV